MITAASASIPTPWSVGDLRKRSRLVCTATGTARHCDRDDTDDDLHQTVCRKPEPDQGPERDRILGSSRCPLCGCSHDRSVASRRLSLSIPLDPGPPVLDSRHVHCKNDQENL